MTNQETQTGDLIEITHRKCGALQPSVRVGDIYGVRAVASTKSGALTLVCASKTAKSGTVRVNSERFTWRKVTIEKLHERKLDDDIETIKRKFSREEKIQIAILPLMFNHLAFEFAATAVDMAIRYRLDFLKKITRGVRETARAYEKMIAKDLDDRHMANIRRNAAEFRAEFANDLSVLYFSLSEQMLRKHPDYPYRDLRCTALLGKVMILLSDEMYHRADIMISERVGTCRAKRRIPLLDTLCTYLEAIAGDLGDTDLDNGDIALCRKVILNRTNQIEISYV